jgi:GT2 family glycosyltransferase/tetratricopeptide (TPR) repeat protein
MPALQPLEEFTESAGGAAAAVRAADAARDARDWPLAADRYRVALRDLPDDAGLWVQFGHALKESGDPQQAESAYRRALDIAPANFDTHLQLGHVLKILGQRSAAIAAYAEAARLDPQGSAAQRELLDLGQRGALPDAATRSTAMWERLSTLGAALADGVTARREWVAGSAYPLAAYDRFRRDIPIRPPPGSLPEPARGAVVILVDAAAAAPFLIRATLRSLQEQSIREWRAVIAAPSATRSHPVASFADIDARMTFVAADDIVAHLSDAVHVLPIVAGTVLDGEALAWLVFAVNRTGARAVFADHDHGIVDPLLGLVRAEPWLPGTFDPYCHGSDAAVVLADVSVAQRALTEPLAGCSIQRRILDNAGPVAHVARLLGTMLALPLAARGGKTSEDDAVPGRLEVTADHAGPRRTAPALPQSGRIAVVIPTRDSPDLLARALTSLRMTARDASRIEIFVMDNGTEATTADLARQHGAQIVPLPGPFNWSRASNLGADRSDAPFLLFANDDIEMLTPGWDDTLVDALSDDAVGAVGVRLLYPDRTVQHGGMVFGLGRGHPEHEGRGQADGDAGPNGRLHSRRCVAAVTGAFLGVRRDRFASVRGFDAALLFVGHSDVDLCLKLRETGLRILYLPEIVAIHAESQTRGRDETKAQVAWDEAERLELVARWGTSLADDVGVSPYWAPGGMPFDGLREPSLREVVRHLDVSASVNPWKPSRKIEQEARSWHPEALI